ncbi:3'(2'),5'-bisphosphate nucleotidase CysQ [Temperatibacter marinus]|uniref:3'(2'),5'-bisphosphate nucleotidase CysQ n=1 Tax=Temperatibacter marinus TaxID=1456591 RepID=A0AA52H8P3_9PROT|nr:3'(2'),5'-bisphosphate nucleotidase CysQ [Temperatibacter marinus]WND01672.1 3'(2'),5'-bisphosphate nucleotidase CysQ [Temperatibacter marinus]
MAKIANNWSIEEDKKLLHKTVREAADIAMHYFRNDDLESWDKSENNPVTEADIAVNKYLQKHLMRNRPEYGWLSEETEDSMDRLKCKRVWIVDPIDGTKAFMKGSDDWGISVALVYTGKPVLACFYAPAQQAFYEAEVSKGAFKNDEEIIVSWQKSLSDARMRGCENAFRSENLWPISWPEEMQCKQQNSIGLRLAQVADAQADCCVSLRPKNEWDIAAADLIVREAGGLVTNGHGQLFVYNQRKPICAHVVASNRTLYSDVLTHFIPAREKWEKKFPA